MSENRHIMFTPMEIAIANIYGKFMGNIMAAHWVGRWELFEFIKRTRLNIRIHGIQELDYVKRGLSHK